MIRLEMWSGSFSIRCGGNPACIGFGAFRSLGQICRRSPDRLHWPFIRLTHRLLYPLVAVMKVFDELVRRLAGVSLVDDPRENAEQVEQEILAVVSEGTAEGKVERTEKMIEGVISFRDLEVGDIMTPRTEIIALDLATATLGEISEKATKDGCRAFQSTKQPWITSWASLREDLLALLAEFSTPPAEPSAPAAGLSSRTFDLRKMMRPPLFVPRTKPLRDLLREFRHQHVHMPLCW